MCALVEAAVPASYADTEIKKRLDILRKTKGANVAKTAVARGLLKIVYHILKERRPYVTAYGKIIEAGATFYFTWRILWKEDYALIKVKELRCRKLQCAYMTWHELEIENILNQAESQLDR